MAGSDQRQDDLFSTESLLAKGRSALKGLKVSVIPNSPFIPSNNSLGRRECLHTTYVPFDTNTGEFVQGPAEGYKLSLPGWSSSECKFTTVRLSSSVILLIFRSSLYTRPQDVIIFMVGGTTYEEARTIALLNQESGGTSAGARLLLGGTCVHNSSRFVIDYIMPLINSSFDPQLSRYVSLSSNIIPCIGVRTSA